MTTLATIYGIVALVVFARIWLKHNCGSAARFDRLPKQLLFTSAVSIGWGFLVIHAFLEWRERLYRKLEKDS